MMEILRAACATLLFRVASAVPTTGDVAGLQRFGCDAPIVLNASSNVWKDYTLHLNSIYRNIVTDAAEI